MRTFAALALILMGCTSESSEGIPDLARSPDFSVVMLPPDLTIDSTDLAFPLDAPSPNCLHGAPDPVVFPDTQAHMSSPMITLTVNNVCANNAAILNVILDGPDASAFSAKELPLQMPMMIAPMSKTQFTLTFSPGRTGPFGAWLTIANDDKNVSQWTVPLVGKGI